MKVLIIEDEKLTAQRLQSILQKTDPSIAVLSIIPSVKQAVSWFQENSSPDLVFMDIHLEDDQCFSIFEKINLDVPIIFTTAFDEYMIQAFKVNSVDYLMKPIDEKELAAALEKFRRIHSSKDSINSLLQSIRHLQSPEYKDRFLVSVGSRLRTIETSEISYFNYSDSITFLTTTGGTRYPIDYSLDKLATLLDPKQFFRVNRQLMIAHRSIAQLHVYPKGRIKIDLQPELKEEVLVSMDRVTAFKEWLGK